MKRYSFRAYPTPVQVRALSRVFGCVRMVFNDFIAERRRQHESGAAFEPASVLARRVTTEAKQTPQRSWLAEVSAVPLQQAVADADRAYRNFFDSLSGKRRGRKIGAPRFKSRHARRQTARFTANARFSVQTTTHGVGFVTLPKVGRVRFALSRELPSSPTSVTVIWEADGTYHVSFVVDEQPALSAPMFEARVAGVDLGLTDYATVVYSDGTREKIANPRYLRASERRLARAQKSLSRKVKGSRNSEEGRARVARLHSHVARQRLNHAHQTAARLVRENQAVVVESLSISGLARGWAAKSVHDAGWGTFLRVLREKADHHGRLLQRADRAFPSTRTCSACGVVDSVKPLHIRDWHCAACGAHLDRDYNAALNLMTLAGGQPERINACGREVRLALAQPERAHPDETGTPRNDDGFHAAA